MPDIIDLLWRDDVAPQPPRRGPRPRISAGDVAATAAALADAGGLPTVTVRALAEKLGVTPMAVYTYVNSREDLLVLMADLAHAQMPVAGQPTTAGWRARVRHLADDNRELLRTRPWLLEVHDPRLVLGPGTIAKYDRELAVFEGLGLADTDQDAVLAYVLDFARAGARRWLDAHSAGELDWHAVATPLSERLGARYPLAQRVGGAAGEQLDGPYDPDSAWRFGMERVLGGLAPLLDDHARHAQ